MFILSWNLKSLVFNFNVLSKFNVSREFIIKVVLNSSLNFNYLQLMNLQHASVHMTAPNDLLFCSYHNYKENRCWAGQLRNTLVGQLFFYSFVKEHINDLPLNNLISFASFLRPSTDTFDIMKNFVFVKT